MRREQGKATPSWSTVYRTVANLEKENYLNNVDLTLLLNKGVDLHSYQPTADDIVKTAPSDLFIYVGGESDGWVDGILEAAQNPNLMTVNILESVEAKEEEMVEGMQEEDHDHDHVHDHGHDEAFTEADIKDRSLCDFAGEWFSLWPMMKDGDLDEYCADEGEDDDDPAPATETYREKYSKPGNDNFHDRVNMSRCAGVRTLDNEAVVPSNIRPRLNRNPEMEASSI